MEVKCETCGERLDDRDVVKGFVVCWKCGWKAKHEEEEYENCVEEEEYVSDWLLY